jgi:hypothetical protein
MADNVTKNVVTVDDDVPNIGRAVGHRRLHLNRATH